MTEPLRLPVGIDDFEKIRKSDFYYVEHLVLKNYFHYRL